MKFTHSKEWVKSSRDTERRRYFKNSYHRGSFGHNPTEELSLEYIHKFCNPGKGVSLTKTLCRVLPMGLLNRTSVLETAKTDYDIVPEELIGLELSRLRRQLNNER